MRRAAERLARSRKDRAFSFARRGPRTKLSESRGWPRTRKGRAHPAKESAPPFCRPNNRRGMRRPEHPHVATTTIRGTTPEPSLPGTVIVDGYLHHRLRG